MSSNGRHVDHTRIMLRPIGSGLPLGFFAFAIGMLLLGCSAIGWIPASEQKDVGMLLIAFVFPLELIATIVAFLARDTLGATTLGLFATSWLSLGWADRSSPPGSTSITLGIVTFARVNVGWVPLLFGAIGVALLFSASVLLIFESRIALASAYAEMDYIRHISGHLAPPKLREARGRRMFR